MKNLKKRLFALLCAVTLLTAALPLSVSAASNPFSDVPDGQYYTKPVLWAVEQGITSGTSATTFSPSTACTRGQIVTFLWRANGEPEPEGTYTSFTDVNSDDYFYKAVLWASENAITRGTGANLFSPDAPCTRSQVVTFLHRSKGMPTPAASSTSFRDVKSSDYFYDAVLWAVSSDITSGTSETAFSPNINCSRGQVMTFLYREANPSPILGAPDISMEDRWLFKGYTTSETEALRYNFQKFLLAPQAPLLDKITYTTPGGKTGTKYSAPTSFPKMQDLLDSADQESAKIYAGSANLAGTTQEQIDSYDIYEFSKFVAAVDKRTSAQWGGFRHTDRSRDVVFKDGSRCRSPYSDSVCNFTRSEAVYQHNISMIVGSEECRTTDEWMDYHIEWVTEWLEEESAEYYYIYIRNTAAGRSAKLEVVCV